jgi:hypothetical protein
MLHAVHDDDFDAFLEGMGLLAEANRGALKCGFCDRNLSKGEIGALFPEDGEIRVVCCDGQCLERVPEGFL